MESIPFLNIVSCFADQRRLMGGTRIVPNAVDHP